MNPAKFCEQCGAALRPTTKFCGNCGVQVQPPPSPPPAPPTALSSPAVAATAIVQASPAAKPNTESVIGVITGLERAKGFMKTEIFNLVITSERLVFALMTQKMINDAIQQARAEIKQQGGGLMEQMGAQMAYLDFIASKYEEMPIEKILTEQSDNFYLAHNQIDSIEIISDEADDDAVLTQVKRALTIEARTGKYQFSWKGGPSTREARQMLYQVLGDKVQ